MRVSPERMGTILGAWGVGSGPLHARLATALAAAIDRGELPPQALLPPERALAEALAVSRTTVVSAYADLKGEGLLDSRQGRGTWVCGPEAPNGSQRPFSQELYLSMLGVDAGTIDVSAACPAPSLLLREALATADPRDLAGAVEGIGYLPAGLPELCERIAERLGRLGLPTVADQVLVTTGAQQAIALTTSLLGEAGQTALVEEATFPGALDALRGMGMRIVGVPQDERGVHPDALEDLIARVRPRLVYLVPVHQNPTGAVISPRRAQRVAELAERYRVPVIEDLALQSLVMRDASPPRGIATGDDGAPVITIGSVSKVLWGGLRVGWVRAPRPTIERLIRLKIMADLGSPVLGQAFCARLLERFDEAVEERRAASTASYRALADGLAERLPDWSWQVPRGGCTLWVKLPHGDARALGQVAQRCGVIIVPGPVLSAEGGHGDHLRLAFLQSPETMAEAVRRLALAWQIYAGGGAPAQSAIGCVI